MTDMASVAEETAQIIDSLPPDKAEALLEFARYLAETAEREQWERCFSDPKYAAKLHELADEALVEFRAGKTQTLDPDQM